MNHISGTTQLICLLGHPVAHSISPAMHNTAFAALDLDYAYLAFAVKEDQLREALDGLRALHFRGCNLTMPLKQTVLPYLDELSEAARLSGAVNTIVNDNGRLTGHTTDGIGYIDALKMENGFSIKGAALTILGAGGAAQSIIVESALSGAASIRIVKRKNAAYPDTVAFAERIASASGCDIAVLPMEDTDALAAAIAESDLLCNATNVGMGEDARSLVPKELFHKNLFVSDIIYHPEETVLLAEAKAAGLRTANGKFMLLYQGAAAFRLWTGMDMPVNEVKARHF